LLAELVILASEDKTPQGLACLEDRIAVSLRLRPRGVIACGGGLQILHEAGDAHTHQGFAKRLRSRERVVRQGTIEIERHRLKVPRQRRLNGRSPSTTLVGSQDG